MTKKIKSLTLKRINYVVLNPDDHENSDWTEDNSYIQTSNEFNEDGKITRAASYDANGTMIETYEYRYDEKGNQVEELLFYDENQEAEHRFFTVDDTGKILQEKVTYQEGSVSQIYYSYDTDGRLTEKKSVDEDGEMEQKEVYMYEGDKLLAEQVYEYDDGLVSEIKHAYDDNNNLVETRVDNVRDDITYRLVFRYDENGKREKMLKYNRNDDLVEKTSYVLDEKDRVIEMTEEDADNIRISRFVYDDRDNIVKQEEFAPNGDLNSSVERRYDDDGNLLETTVYIDRHGAGYDQYYTVQYEYEYHDIEGAGD